MLEHRRASKFNSPDKESYDVNIHHCRPDRNWRSRRPRGRYLEQHRCNSGGKAWNLDVAAYVATIAVLGALAGLFFQTAFKHNKVAGSVLVVGWLFGLVFSIGASLDRVAGAKDSKIHAAQTVNARIERAEAAVTRWQDKLAQQRPIAALECRGYREGKSKPKRWPKCLTAKSLTKQYQSELESAISKRDQLGIVGETDSGGARVAALTFGAIKPQQWKILHPILGVISLTGLFNGLLLLAGSMFANASTPPTIINGTAVEVKPGKIKALGREQQIRLFLTDFRARRGRDASHKETVTALQLPPSTVSKYRNKILTAA